MKEIYRCLDCDEVFSVLVLSQGPDWSTDVNAEEECHRGHLLRRLHPARGRSWSRDPYDAPARTVWAAVTDGKEEFLLMRHKESPALPCRYRLLRGTVVDLPPVLSFPEEDLLRQIVVTRTGSSPTLQEVATFVGMLRQSIRTLDPLMLEEEYGDHHDPLLSHARLPSVLLGDVLDRCREHLSPAATSWFADFIRDHADSESVLGVTVRRDFLVVEKGAATAEGEAVRRSVA